MDLYGRITSSNVQVVRWCLAELGVSYTRHDVGGKFGGLDTPEYRALNPNGKIPCLVVQGNAIFESSAILRYLASRYGHAPFWPQDPLPRAQIDKWAEWSKRSVADLFTGPIFWRVVRTPKARHDQPAIDSAVSELEAELKVADTQLATNTYLAGTHFTLADIVLGHVLFRYYDIKITRAELPNLRRYYDQLTERQAYKDTVMISYEDLRDTL